VWNAADDTLLSGMATGDADAAAAFVGRFQRRVYGLALTMTRDPRVAEDVAQEAFLRAWQHAEAYDSRRGSVTTWLLTITRNLAIDSLRVRRPVTLEPELLLALGPEADEVLPDGAALAGEDAARVRAALVELPEEQRRAIVLAGLYGLSAREVAERESIPLGTAKTRIRTAMRRLRALLGTEERTE
jgi:RNA polymerase sigma factor (sigma-70 family)